MNYGEPLYKGVFAKQRQDLSRSPEEWYIHEVHSYGETNIIVTFVPALAARLHDALETAHDNTYKQVHGDWKEWEATLWDRKLNTRKQLQY